MIRNKYIVLALFTGFIALGLTSCEDVIEVETGFETPQLVVDAWIDNRSQDQTITLSLSQDYFDSSLPSGIENASVVVRKDDFSYEFNHTEDGKYVWSPNDGESLGTVGDEFELEIRYNESTYVSNTKINRVPVIDSIALIFEEASPIFEEGLYGEAYAIDFVGEGDSYWMKTWVNDTLLNKPFELNIIWDATFDPGSGLDGVTFIPPKRRTITPIDDDNSLIPFVSGDHIYVELHSISNDAFQFLAITFEQITNSENGIFTLPLANAPGNVVNRDSGESVLGVFNVAAITTNERTVE